MPNFVLDERDRYTYQDRPNPEPLASVDVISVDIYYDLGGSNFFSGTVEERGIYVSISPVTLSASATGRLSASTTFFSGIKNLVLPLQRKSAGKLGLVARLLDAQAPEMAQTWRNSRSAASKMLQDWTATVAANLSQDVPGNTQTPARRRGRS